MTHGTPDSQHTLAFLRHTARTTAWRVPSSITANYAWTRPARKPRSLTALQQSSLAELPCRRQAVLSPAQDALLVRWGYPYVMEYFRFHCSLTGSLQGVTAQQVHALRQVAQAWLGALPRCRLESLALFSKPAQGADMVRVEHVRPRA